MKGHAGGVEAREACLAAEPKEDVHFVEVFAHELAHAGGYAREGEAHGGRCGRIFLTYGSGSQTYGVLPDQRPAPHR